MFLARGFRNPAWKINLFLPAPRAARLWQLETSVHRAAICCHQYGLWCLVKNTGLVVPEKTDPSLLNIKEALSNVDCMKYPFWWCSLQEEYIPLTTLNPVILISEDLSAACVKFWSCHSIPVKCSLKKNKQKTKQKPNSSSTAKQASLFPIFLLKSYEYSPLPHICI